MTDFIPLFRFDSENLKDIEHTLYINKNTIIAFSHFKIKNNIDKECLLVKFGVNRNDIPKEYVICKEDNPVAFNALFNRLPDKLPKHNNTPFS